jgi:metal-responsive CopG/Arc/MetJ family transcriptional regulator
MARIIISLPSELLDELDNFATEQFYNRSECIRHAIRIMIQTTTKKEQNDPEESIQE